MLAKLLVFIFLLNSCSSIRFLSKKKPYSDQVHQQLEQASAEQKQGRLQSAIQILTKMSDKDLSDVEKAGKYNQLGVIYFSQNDLIKSNQNFLMALQYADEASDLISSINLNIASVQFRKGEHSKSFQTLQMINHEILSADEHVKYWKMNQSLAEILKIPSQVVESVMHLNSSKLSKNEFMATPGVNAMIANFDQLDKRSKSKLLSDMVEVNPIGTAILAEKEALRLHRYGDHESLDQLISWMESNLKNFSFISSLITDLKSKVESSDSIKAFSIGVILPLSGEKAFFGEKALLGIEMALREYEASSGQKIEWHIRDDRDQAAVGEYLVDELITNKKVSIIVGGLFSTVAKNEYLASKRKGTLFISLSQLILPREFKDKLLFEIPGSIESQIHAMKEEKIADKLGKRVAMIYPDSDYGQAYLEEFWANRSEMGVVVRTAAKYQRESSDLRDPVMLLLGLKFPRERQQELNLWNEISQLEGERSVRKIQNLPPVIDFDWVYMVSNPQETQKIIPTIKYFDALDMVYVGGPSWQSKGLVREQQDLGKLLFVGNMEEENMKKFSDGFAALFAKDPGIAGYLAYEGMKLASLLFINDSSREDFTNNVKSKSSLNTDISNWIDEKGVWLKKMDLLKIAKGNIEKVQ